MAEKESYPEIWLIYYASGGWAGRIGISEQDAAEAVAYLDKVNERIPGCSPHYAAKYAREDLFEGAGRAYMIQVVNHMFDRGAIGTMDAREELEAIEAGWGKMPTPTKSPAIAEAERRGARGMILYLLGKGDIDREKAEVARRAIEAGWVKPEKQR